MLLRSIKQWGIGKTPNIAEIHASIACWMGQPWLIAKNIDFAPYLTQ
jgi:hypothetical protein